MSHQTNTALEDSDYLNKYGANIESSKTERGADVIDDTLVPETESKRTSLQKNLSPKNILSPPLKSSIGNVNNITGKNGVKTPEGNLVQYDSPKLMNVETSPLSNHSSHLEKADANLEPKGNINDYFQRLSDSVKSLVHDVETSQDNSANNNIEKIATMSKALTNEANALRESIKSLSDDITRTKQEFCYCETDVNLNFPYHLFLIEIIINKIHMKCECFNIDYNNLVISAEFLGKQPILLYDSSYGKLEDFDKLNVGKSILFAMTYDKICSIKEFVIILYLTKQPPCSTCVTKIGETRVDYTKEYISLRDELCTKWKEQQPADNILCTTSIPLSKNMYYISCGTGDKSDSIGIIEVTVRMSFLGKEITTAFCARPKTQGPSFLLKDEHGMTMYSCQKVEMNDQGKILLDECVMSKKNSPCSLNRSIESPYSLASSLISKHTYENTRRDDHTSRYDEIYTKMNVNELKIRVPKSTKAERTGKYDKIRELCECDSTAYNNREQIQFDLPNENTYPEKTYTSNLKYTMKGLEKMDKRDRKIINVTPTNCSIPVGMSKMIHPQKDVFILKIGKKLETKDKKTDLEIELITPKPPFEKPIDIIKNISAQCSSIDVKKPVKVKDKKNRKGGKMKKDKELKTKKIKGDKINKIKGDKTNKIKDDKTNKIKDDKTNKIKAKKAC